MANTVTNPLSNNRILVTGASGFTGSWLTEHLLEQGATVITFLLEPAPESVFVQRRLIDRVRNVRASILDFPLLVRTIKSQGIDTVFHLAGVSVENSVYERPRESFEANIRGTYNVLDACRENAKTVERVIVASSDKVYGDSPTLPYHEGLPVQGMNPYDVSKSCADMLARCYYQSYGLPVAVARFANIYGGGDLNWTRLIPNTIRQLLRGERPLLRSPPAGEYKRDFLYIADQVRAYMALFEGLARDDGVRGEAFNFGMGDCFSVREVIKKIARLMGIEIERAEPLVQTAGHREILHQQLSCEKASNLLGWKPECSIDDGLAETIAWYTDFLDTPRVSTSSYTDQSPPDPRIIFDLILAFRRSKTMFAAVSLGVFDQLQSGDKTAAALAAALNLNEDALQRLLNACVCLQLLTLRDGQYANSAVAVRYLCSRSPHRLTGYINCSNDGFWKLWGNLEGAIKEGTNRWKQTFGLEGSYWEGFYKDAAAMREFLVGLHGYGQITSPHVVGAFDLSRFRTLIDLGGGTGHLAIAACKAYPELRAVVFDLPKACPLAREFTESSEVADRITVQGGDFFKDPLPHADLYVLARTLHDWNESMVVELLSKVYASLEAGGAILIAEKLLSESQTEPDTALMQHLNMLAIAEGRERTLSEYKDMLAKGIALAVDTGIGQNGAFDVRAVITDSPVDAILAVKQ